MKLKTLCIAAFAFLANGLMVAEAAPVDLSDWVAEGTGNWVLQPGNNSVLQTLNDFPTVFHNNANSQGMQLGGTIQVQTTFDDDFIGFVLGFNAGDFDNPSPDYLLIDWRQADQVVGCGLSTAGLSISRVTESIVGFGNTGCRGGGIVELQRAANLGDTGWEDNREYTFDLIFTESVVQVLVDGVLEISIAGSFANGSFGFYNSSQQEVLYAGIEEDIAQVVPLPAAAPLMATVLGLGGAYLRRRRSKNA